MDLILILSCLDGEKVQKWQEMEFSFHFLYVLSRCVTQLYRVNKSARQIADSNKKQMKLDEMTFFPDVK